MNRQAGKTSVSFIFAIVLAVAAIGGYLAFRFWPDDVKRSEWIVREFNKDAGKAVGDFRRALRELKSAAGKEAPDADAVEKRMADAFKQVDQLVDEAHSKLDDLGDVPLRTHRNRGDRIDEKGKETKEAIQEEAAQARGAK